MIIINDDYGVQADTNCYSVVKKYIAGPDTKDKTKTPGEPYWLPIASYHGTLHGALKAVIRRLQRESANGPDMTLKQAYAAFKAIENDVMRFGEE